MQFLRFNILFSLCLISGTLVGSGLGDEKSKTIEKTFSVKPHTQLEVSNQFGEIHLESWDKKELYVKVEILVEGRNEDRASRLLDKIRINISEGSTISFETEYDGNMSTKGEESFEVNYLIKFPPENSIAIENKFGDTYIDDRKGESKIEVSYGNLKTESFSGMLFLDLSFGNGTLGDTKGAEIEVKYSDLRMGSGTEMEMEQQFSEVDLGSFQTLNLESKYGNVNVSSVGDLETDAQFSGLRIGKLTGSLDMEASYVSDFEIGELSTTFSRVEIYGKFSNYEIRLAKGLRANLEAEMSFSRLNNRTDSMDIYYEVTDDNRSEYKARIGGGDSSRRIIVKSSYGDLRIE